MNKSKSIIKLNRTRSHRRAMLRNMATSLLEHERIITTRIKAKALGRYVEPLITLARKNLLAKGKGAEAQMLYHKRRVLSSLRGTKISKKLFEDIAPRYKDRMGGYIRIIHLPERKSDASKMSIIELVERREKVKQIKQLGSKASVRKDVKQDKKAAVGGVSEVSAKGEKKWYQRLGRNPKTWD